MEKAEKNLPENKVKSQTVIEVLMRQKEQA